MKKEFAKKNIHIKAFEVRTESGTCPGIAQTEQGETYVLKGRTPDQPICVQALNGIVPMAHAMALT